MWGDVLGLGFFTAFNPTLLGFILLVISRPRSAQNLLMFWAASLLVNVPSFLIPLLLLHGVPSFAAFATAVAGPDPGSAVKPFQLGSGLFALCVAVAMTVRAAIRRRAKAVASVPVVNNSSVLTLDGSEPEAQPPPDGIRGLIARVRATLRELTRRASIAWESGVLWVAFVLGLMYVPPPPLVLLVDTMVIGSGASIGTQVLAVTAFILTMFAVFDLVLVSYLLAPRKTQVLLRPVHEWALARRPQILLVLFAIVGVWLTITGAGLIDS